MTPYVPSGQSEPGGLTRAMLVATLAGVVIGGLAHLVGNWIRLIVLFPIVMGVGAGAAGALVVKRWKVRSPRLAAITGLVGAVVAWGVDFGIGFVRDRGALTQMFATMAVEAEKEGIKVPDGAASGAADRALVALAEGRELTPEVAWVFLTNEPLQLEGGGQLDPVPAPNPVAVVSAWITSRARAGTKISKSGRDSGIELGETGTWILWLVELGIMVGMGATVPWKAASEPFCEPCGEWFPEQFDLLLMGGLDRKPEVMDALDQDDGAKLGAISATAGMPDVHLTMKLRHCPRCPAEPWFFQLIKVTKTAKETKTKDQESGLLPPTAIAACLAALQAPGKAAEGEEERLVEGPIVGP